MLVYVSLPSLFLLLCCFDLPHTSHDNDPHSGHSSSIIIPSPIPSSLRTHFVVSPPRKPPLFVRCGFVVCYAYVSCRPFPHSLHCIYRYALLVSLFCLFARFPKLFCPFQSRLCHCCLFVVAVIDHSRSIIVDILPLASYIHPYISEAVEGMG